MPVNDVQTQVDNMSEEAKKYRENLTTELAKIDEGIDHLAANVKKTSAEIQAEYETRLQELKARRRLVEVKLAEFQQSSEAAIGTAQEGLETVWNDLVNTFKQVTEEFNNRK